MKVLLVGGGGREHALAWKIAQSPKVTKLFCAPGNAGISQVAECVPIAAEAVHELLQFAKDQKIDLTVVGPEQPLVIGIVDTFRQQGLRIFGPTQGAARLEGSKVFTKRFLEKYRIPTASYGIFDTYEAALSSIQKDNFPLVMKADGLAAGKGVLICQDFGEGKEALEVFFRKRAFRAAGKRIVIEEFLKGEEVSYIAFSDGEHFLPLASSKDHKRIFDNDQGLNTGGMGAFSPTPAFTPDLEKRVIETVIRPTIQGMKDEGTPFEGILYVGLMLTKEGPKVLEFNVRMGDPETQPLLVRMKTDIIEIIEKPKDPPSNYAVTGLYIYDNRVFNCINQCKPSNRGELEITEVNNFYIRKNQLQWAELKGYWSDAGTFDTLFLSNQYWAKKKNTSI